MTDSPQREDYQRKIQNLAVAGSCLLLLALVLAPTVYVLDDMGLLGWGALAALVIIAFLLVIVGAICGHIALRKFKTNPETPMRFKRLAMAGAIIGYGVLAFCILVFAFFWFIVFPGLMHSH